MRGSQKFNIEAVFGVRFLWGGFWPPSVFKNNTPKTVPLKIRTHTNVEKELENMNGILSMFVDIN